MLCKCFLENRFQDLLHVMLSSGGSKGGARDAPRAQILSIPCSFWEILAKSYVGAPPPGSWRPLLGEILDPLLLRLHIPFLSDSPLICSQHHRNVFNPF